jgi:hypothetical protein
MFLLQYRNLEEREGGRGGRGRGRRREEGTCLKSDKRRRQVVYRLIKVGSSGEKDKFGRQFIHRLVKISGKKE